jgi:hypothetical protein
MGTPVVAMVQSQQPKNFRNKNYLFINSETFYRIEISGVFYEILKK